MTQTIKFKQIAKDRLFYDLWQYCVSFHLPEVTALKKVDHEYIDQVIARRRIWRAGIRQRWAHISPTAGSLSPAADDITEATKENLHAFADLLLDTNKPFKLVTSINYGWVYTNDLLVVQALADSDIPKNKGYSQAYVNRSKDTIKLKNPKFTHRTYLRSGRIDPVEKQNIKRFLHNQKDYIRTGPALTRWLNTPFYFVHDNFFIDHNGEDWLILISLVKAGLVRKTISIVPA